MREEDRIRLEQKRDYPDGEAATRHLEEVLGLEVKAVRELLGEMRGDLDPVRFGIGWWSPDPDDKRRILIGDHIVQCAIGIVANQTDAALHLLEYEGWFEETERRLAHVLSLTGEFAYPKPGSPSDLLPHQHLNMHLAGFFRALGSTLDCLSAVTVGILGIPMTIVTADFSKLRDWLRGTRSKTVPRHPIQTDFGLKLEACIVEAGPPGWAEWVDSYRNMLVHRARRLTLTTCNAEAHIVDARGRPIPRIVSVPVLASDPSKSDIQAMVDDPMPVLKEDGRKTMRGAFSSIRYLADQSCKLLCEIWKRRRSCPSLIRQPREEWPNVRGLTANIFSGYESRKIEIRPTALMTDPSAPRRLEAAALTTGKRPLWDAVLTG